MGKKEHTGVADPAKHERIKGSSEIEEAIMKALDSSAQRRDEEPSEDRYSSAFEK